MVFMFKAQELLNFRFNICVSWCVAIRYGTKFFITNHNKYGIIKNMMMVIRP